MSIKKFLSQEELDRILLMVKHRLENSKLEEDDGELGWHLIGHCYIFLHDQLNEKSTFEWKISKMKQLLDQAIIPASQVFNESMEKFDELKEDEKIFVDVLKGFVQMNTEYHFRQKSIH